MDPLTLRPCYKRLVDGGWKVEKLSHNAWSIRRFIWSFRRFARSIRRFVDTSARLVLGHDVFISYRWKSGRVYAAALAHRLEKEGLSCFIDVKELRVGETIAPFLNRVVRRSTVFVLVGTSDVRESHWVPQELTAFLETKGKVIPVVDGTCTDVFDQAESRPWSDLRGRLVVGELADRLSGGEPTDDVVGVSAQSQEMPITVGRQDGAIVSTLGVSDRYVAAAFSFWLDHSQSVGVWDVDGANERIEQAEQTGIAPPLAVYPMPDSETHYRTDAVAFSDDEHELVVVGTAATGTVVTTWPFYDLEALMERGREVVGEER